ncbi:Prephenate dehydratase-domain-containing protein [Pisolithus orientalis]|uniref:Prephenate dehydratase-domain-containing protein n=1 Tax=Pisolithus orientalis TaxID=936130 RepID=UPI002224ADAD|nr:Prephenate dehydratase-domain-containing protein [Pisolithus orientalis]KAI6005284.1 Prephenate dehydratase-domain-containing protein [Pisolithus orientalis]
MCGLDPIRPTLAFLGPVGTYSHQAAYDCFGNSVDYVPKQTIQAVFRSLSLDLPLGIVPQENSTHGSVIETYDILRDPAIGQSNFIRGSTILAVRHCLVVRQGVKLENIDHVLSHGQALGQCRSFLARLLPWASLVPTDSTASAAEQISNGTTAFDPYRCAAICSSIVTTVFEGLEVLLDSIQDGEANSTRFYIVSHGSDSTLPPSRISPVRREALLRTSTSQESHGTSECKRLNFVKFIKALDLEILRVDRRPALHALTFRDVYFLEVGDIGGNTPWSEKLSQALQRATYPGIEVTLLGKW